MKHILAYADMESICRRLLPTSDIYSRSADYGLECSLYSHSSVASRVSSVAGIFLVSGSLSGRATAVASGIFLVELPSWLKVCSLAWDSRADSASLPYTVAISS